MANIINGDGSSAADTIKVTESNIAVTAGSGNDTINLVSGSRNVIHGDTGNDSITVEKSAGTGNIIYGDAGDDTIKAQTSCRSLLIFGDDGNDTLIGSTENDRLYGGADDDNLNGADGDDELYGGSGDDEMLGQAGNDKLYGGDGADMLYGGFGDDELYGENGNDRLEGGDGSDELYGYAGDDVLFGQQGNDYLYGGAGADKLYGGSGNDKIYGDAGDDVLDGYTGNDTLTGGAGNDTLSGGTGSDLFVYANGDGSDTVTDYTAGEDTIKITGGSTSKIELAPSGTDVKFTVGSGSVLVKNGKGKVISLEDSRGSYTVSDTRIALGKDFKGEMDAGEYLSTVTNIAGSSATIAVTLRGNANANVMSGGAQADTLYGGDGADKLYGYGGNDILFGQAGNDYLYGGAGADKLYGGSGDDVIYGNAGDDVLDGYTGNDRLEGGEGNDTLTGGVGNDSLSGGTGSDAFVYANGDGSDTVTDYTAGEDTIKITGGSISKTELGSNGTDVKFTLGSGSITVQNGKGKVISLEDSRGSYTVSDTRIALGKDFKGEMDAGKYLSTVTNIAGSGAEAAVTLRGNANNNVMSGGARADTMYGGEGADKLYGYGGNDVLYGQQSNDSLYGGEGADKLYGGSGDDMIYGNAGDDVLDGYTGNDRLEGGEGNDTLAGGAGNDTFSGGAGSDLFVYANGDGSDTITDYTTGEDTIKITSGSISRTELYGNDVKFAIGSGSVLVKSGKGKVISLEDSRGSYTVSDTRIALSKGFTGEMDAGKYLSTVTNIAGSGAEAAVTLRGNANNNVMSGGAQADTMYGGEGADKLYGYGGNDVLYGQQGNDTLYGGEGADKLYGGSGDDKIYGDAGDDVLDGYTGNDRLEGGDGNDTLAGGAGNDTFSGGAGNDLFVYANGDGSDTITDYTAGEDTIKIASGTISKADVVNDGKDIKFTIGNGSVLVKNGIGKTIDYVDSNGNKVSLASVTQLDVIKKFIKYLDDSTAIRESLETELDQAVSYASNGFYKTWSGLVDSFINDIRSFGATTTAQAKDFLLTYCGINLDNEDTGSITGADAGGAIVKTAESIVPEKGTIDDLYYPASESTTINGLTFHWPQTQDPAQIAVIKGINTWWAQEGLKLVEESFGLSFTEEGTAVRSIDVEFENSGSVELAKVTGRYYPLSGVTSELTLTVNMRYYDEKVATDVNGISKESSQYLDRVLAHELTHAVMAANIKGFFDLPDCIVEGSAELVHGIDDTHNELVDFVNLSYNNMLQRLEDTLSLSESTIYYWPDPAYAGGYMFLRYFAKQSADNYFSTLISNHSNILADSVSGSVASDASLLWVDENMSAVADTGSEISTSMTAVSNAMLTPMDSTVSDLFRTDSLSSGLFSDTKKNQSYLG